MRPVIRIPGLIAILAGTLLLCSCADQRPLSVPTTTTAPLAQPTEPESTQPLTLRITFPEGYTVLQIADRLEENEVCTAEEFLEAVQGADLSGYPFGADIPPVKDGEEPNGRVWRLEGYLFPDTYEFYRHGSGEAALARFLANFEEKFRQLREDLAFCGLTMDQAVTLASMLQWEGNTGTDMARMSRVFWNRLESPSYPKLQSDVTTRYCRQLEAAGVAVDKQAYDTYLCRGLPVGPINNPGLDALKAAVCPSDEEVCAGCYFFFTDEDTGDVYYSRTYDQHLKAWNELQKKKESGGGEKE